MKYMISSKYIFCFYFKSLSFEDSEMVYEDKLVAFASISANLPVIDTIFVYQTFSFRPKLLFLKGFLL